MHGDILLHQTRSYILNYYFNFILIFSFISQRLNLGCFTASGLLPSW